MRHNNSLKEKVFAQVKKNIKTVLSNTRFFLRNFGDWNVQLCVPCSEFKGWDNGSILEHFGNEMSKLGEMDKNRAMLNFFSSVFMDSYEKGVVSCGWSQYKLIRTERLDAYRREVLTVKAAVEKLGYTIKPYEPSFEYLYVYNEPYFKNGYYITMLLKSKELEEWRDMMYQGYSQSDECRLEHEMERRAEVQFEDMVMGTNNL